jgi:copper chaperone CopZ
MTTLKVPDMHCEKCVERITNALNVAKLIFQISLKDKTVIIDGDESNVNTAIEALDDLGFDVEI